MRVVFSDRAYAAVLAETTEKIKTETGGLLLGKFQDDEWYVIEAIDPGPKSVFQVAYFEYDQQYTQHLINKIANLYDVPLSLIGLWHRHPGSLDQFSSTDDGTNSKYANMRPEGAISGLVNIDPVFRLTMYHVLSPCKYSKISYVVGDDLIARDLVKTKYGFQNISFNGKEMCVYDDPIGTHSLLIKEQGNSNYRMCGTCGLCQSANIMTMAGVPTTENDIISIALHSSDGVLHSMELFEEDPDERGGTTVNNRKEILESQGIPITNHPINIDRARTVRQLASAVASGHGVILSVDVERLWRNGQSGGHAISLLSVSRDGSTFIYSDTGAGEINTISAADLAAALTGRPANITTNIIR